MAVVCQPVISLDVEFVVSVAPEGSAIILNSLALFSGHDGWNYGQIYG